MAIDDKMMDELTRFLSESPKWRARMREALFETSEDHFDRRLDSIQGTLDSLVISHAQSLERFDRLEQSHVKAIERLERLEHSHTEAIIRLERLEHSHAEAIIRLERLEQSQIKLWEELRALKEIVERLVHWAERAETDLGKLKGYALELRFLDRAPGFFGYYVRKPKIVNIGQFLDDLREEGQSFTQEEWDQVVALDALLTAVHPSNSEKLVLAIEVSWMIYPDDVERANERAGILASKGVPAFPAVAGEGITPEARELAESRKMMVLLDGRAITAGAFTA